jgi:hypothetical protein
MPQGERRAGRRRRIRGRRRRRSVSPLSAPPSLSLSPLPFFARLASRIPPSAAAESLRVVRTSNGHYGVNMRIDEPSSSPSRGWAADTGAGWDAATSIDSAPAGASVVAPLDGAASDDAAQGGGAALDESVAYEDDGTPSD